MPSADRRQVLISLVASLVATLGGRLSKAAVPHDTSVLAQQRGTEAEWQSVIETLFPHKGIDRDLYAVPARALLEAAKKDVSTQQLLESCWLQLNRATAGGWASATPGMRALALESLVGTPPFTLLRQTAVLTFYADPRVWKAFGYEGDAWRFGGYQGRVNTLDWLPNPPTASPATR